MRGIICIKSKNGAAVIQLDGVLHYGLFAIQYKPHRFHEHVLDSNNFITSDSMKFTIITDMCFDRELRNEIKTSDLISWTISSISVEKIDQYIRDSHDAICTVVKVCRRY